MLRLAFRVSFRRNIRSQGLALCGVASAEPTAPIASVGLNKNVASLESLLQTDVKNIKANDISAVLATSTHQSISLSSNQIRLLMRSIRGNAENFPTHATTSILYGMRNHSSDIKDVRELISAVSEHLERDSSLFSAAEICRCVAGMQHFSSKYVEVRQLLRILVSRYDSSVSNSDTRVEISDISGLFSGIGGMSTDHSEVRDLLSGVVIPCVADSSLPPAIIMQGMYGMRRMSSTHSETRSLLGALLASVDNSVDSAINARDIARALHGLQGTTCRDGSGLEVSGALEQLSKWLGVAKGFMSHKDIAAGLRGLQRMSSTDHSAVGEFVEVLARHISESPKETWYPRSISVALYTIRNLDSRNTSVERLHESLAEAFSFGATAKDSKGLKWNERDAGIAIAGAKGIVERTSGIQCMGTKKLLTALSLRTKGFQDQPESGDGGKALVDLNSLLSSHLSTNTMDPCMTLNRLRDTRTPTRVALQTVQSTLPALRDTEKLSGSQITAALNGLQNLDGGSPAVREVVRILAERLQTLLSETEEVILSSQDMGLCFHGLRNMTSDYVEVRAMVSALAQVLALQGTQKKDGMKWVLTTPSIQSAFNMLHHMRSDHKEVRMFMAALRTHLVYAASLSTFTKGPGLRIGRVMTCLQNMTTAHAETRALVSALCDALPPPAPMLNREAAMAARGLVGMTTTHREVRRLVGVLAAHMSEPITHVTDVLTEKDFTLFLSGIKGLETSHSETRQLLHLFAQRVSNNSTTYSWQSVVKSVYGLQNMSSDCSEVRALLKVIADKLRADNAREIHPNDVVRDRDLDAQAVGMCLYGLQNMSSEHVEVRNLLSGVLQHIARRENNLIFTPQSLTMAMYGLQCMGSGHKEVVDIVGILASGFRRMLNDPDRNELDWRHVATVLYGLKGMSSDPPQVKAVLASVIQLMSRLEKRNLSPEIRDIAMCLTGLQSMSTTSIEVRDLFVSLVGLLSSTQITSASLATSASLRSRPVSPCQYVAMCLQSIGCLSEDEESSRRLLPVFTHHLLESYAPPLSVPTIAVSVYALRNLTVRNSHDEVAHLAHALSYRVREAGRIQSIDGSKGRVDSLSVRILVMGLKGLSSEFACVRSLVDAVAELLESTDYIKQKDVVSSSISMLRLPYSSETFSMPSLYGMQNLVSEHEEVRRLMQAVNVVLRSEDTVAFSGAQEIAMMLYGMKGMSSHHKETLALVTTVCEMLRKTGPCQFSAQEVAMCFYGLQSMSSDSREVRTLLEAITEKIKPDDEDILYSHSNRSCGSVMDAQAIGMSLYGLQNMRSDNIEVRNALVAIADRISESSSHICLSSHERTLAMRGLQNLSMDYACVKELYDIVDHLSSSSQ